ncbi:hypothetical protein EWH99_02695 [Sporolactobacillus sp. THM7-7]|nr:hypothetical protein EWH99_02695 [Sporolactobacillus sp. THM7-7]
MQSDGSPAIFFFVAGYDIKINIMDQKVRMKTDMPILDTLKRMYRDAFIEQPESAEDPKAFDWFRTKDDRIFGIRREHLSANERQLLKLTFTPYSIEPLNRTKKQQAWANLLYDNVPPVNTPVLPQEIRLVYFVLHRFEDRHRNLNAAIKSFFNRSYLTTIWKTTSEGVIILKNRGDRSCEELIDLVTADFYCDIMMLNVPDVVVSGLSETSSRHRLLFQLARHLFPNQKYFEYVHLFPLMLVHAFADQSRFEIKEWRARIGSLPPELVQSINVYFHHNFNLSTAAGALYIHRNSLQYRLDRVHRMTGLDPKQFHDAVIISLLLLNDHYERWAAEQKKESES